MADAERRLFALLFHPEVVHTESGLEILRNFAYRVVRMHRRLDDGVVCRGGDRADPRAGRARDAWCAGSAAASTRPWPRCWCTGPSAIG